MRLGSQSNQFKFNFPSDFISEEVNIKLKQYMDKNFIQYDQPIDYINSTIKEIVFPSIQIDGSIQIHKFSKQVEYKPTQNIHDLNTSELDITFRDIDSHTNYFMLRQIIIEYYNNTRKYYMPWLNLDILDKDGDVMYSIKFRDVLWKSESELRLSYNSQDISEQTFSMTFRFIYLDIDWMLSDTPEIIGQSVYDTKVWTHENILPSQRPQNDYKKE
jgi:hypothetical protein